MRLGLVAIVTLMLASAGLPALADDAQVGAIAIKGPWSRATPPGAPAGVVFLTIVNGGTEDDALISVGADVAKTAELHSHVMEGDVMRMRQVPSIAVPAGQAISLAPGGLHIMLIGPTQPLAEGSRFPLTLTFRRAGSVTVSVPVQGIGGMPPGMGHDPAMHDHMHDHMHDMSH